MADIQNQNGNGQKKRLVLIDGYGIIFRAYHAVRVNLATSQGELTNATFGFTSMLLEVLKRDAPDYIVMAFDGAKATFRHEEFTDYKANRGDMPEDLRSQLGRIRQVVEAMGITIYVQEGFEADDIIGTLATQAAEQELETVIVTGDNDLLQLVNEHVTAAMPGAGPKGQFSEPRYLNPQGVVEKYGFEPKYVPDFKAMRGDKSDNIPSVPGVGDTTATKLIVEYGHIENILAHLDEIKPPKIQEALRTYRDQVIQSKRIATIVTDMPLKLELEKLKVGQGDKNRVLEIFRELEFNSLLKKLSGMTFIEDGATESAPASAPATTPKPASAKAKKNGQMSMFDMDSPDIKMQAAPVEEAASPAPLDAKPNIPAGATYTAVRTPEQLQKLVKKLEKATRFAFDTETDSTNPLRAKLVGVSLSHEPGESYYIPVGHIESDGQRVKEQLEWETVRAAIQPIFNNPAIAKIAHHAQYDISVLHRAGLELHGYSISFDTMIAAQLIGFQRSGLKDLAFNRLTIQMTEIESLIGSGKKQTTFDYVNIDAATAYAAADADMTLRLADDLAPQLEKDGLKKLFDEIEMPLIPVLATMELCGIGLDVGALQGISTTLYANIHELEKQIFEEIGYPFNINSTDQLATALGKLGLSGGKKTAKGKMSTNKESLEALRDKHPVVGVVLDYRHLAKLKSTYVDSLPLILNPETGRVHTSFHQIGSATGRVSSSDPNLQNIPIRSDIGGEIRRAFVAESKYYDEPAVLFAADYSQIELRILAHFSQDDRLLDAFKNGEDIHTATAADVFGIKPEEVTPNIRRLAKTVNFGIIYGLSAFGLSSRTDFTYQEANEFIKRYNEKFPTIKAYLDKTPEQARKVGYVQTIFGRRRYMPELTGQGVAPSMRQAAERQAINMPVQGTAADIVKIAMNKIFAEMREKKLRSKLLLQVHDELVFEAPRSEIPQLAEIVKRNMENVVNLDVPLKADLKFGQNWRDMESYKLD
jgi:DNA polymerase I